MNNDFWTGRKVLLTGNTGFKGTWMSLMLEYLGARVCGYALPLEENMFYLDVKPRIERMVEADITDLGEVRKTVDEYEPEIIFHFAAHSSLQGSTEIPEYIIKTNIVGTLNVLEAARLSKSVRSIVVVTSDKCYFNENKNCKYQEDATLWASDPYSSSKVGQELLTDCYMKTFFQKKEKHISIASVRASNVIGPGDYNKTRLIPYLLDEFANGKSPVIRSPYAVRPWQYVLDVLNGYLILAQSLFENTDNTELDGAYNFGPMDDGFVDVETITKMISERFENIPFRIILGNRHNVEEKRMLMLDSSKAQRVLGWKCKYSLEQTVGVIANYVKQEITGDKPDILARNLVRQFYS